MKTIQTKTLMMAALAATYLGLTPAYAYEAVPTGHFVGKIERIENGSSGSYEVDLFIKAQGDRVYAVQLEKGLGDRKGTNYGLVMQVEVVDNGNLGFRKLFVDGTSAAPRATDVQMLEGRPQYRTLRGGRTELEIEISREEENGFPGYTYVARRPHLPFRWKNYTAPKSPLFRAQDPFKGELSMKPNGQSLHLSLQTTSPEIALPCGINSADVEINEIFPGIFGLQRVGMDLKTSGGLALAKSLYGFVIPVSRSNNFEGYDTLNIVTYQAEGCTGELAPGSGVSTRNVAFDNKSLF